MSLRDLPKTVWALFTALGERGGALMLEDVPFTGVRVTVDPAQGCQLDWCQGGEVAGPYAEDLLSLDQRKVVWGLDENMDMDDLERVLHDDVLFDGSVLHCRRPRFREPGLWSLIEYRNGELTGNWLWWYPDGQLQEYSRETKLDHREMFLEQRFGWFEDGALRSSYLHLTDRRGTSARAPIVRFDDRGRLCELGWHPPERVLRLVPEIRNLADDQVFLDPSDLAGVSLGRQMSLTLAEPLPALLEVLLADEGPAELEELSCWLHADDLHRILVGAPRLRQVQYNGPDESGVVDALLDRWQGEAPGRTVEVRRRRGWES